MYRTGPDLARRAPPALADLIEARLDVAYAEGWREGALIVGTIAGAACAALGCLFALVLGA